MKRTKCVLFYLQKSVEEDWMGSFKDKDYKSLNAKKLRNGAICYNSSKRTWGVKKLTHKVSLMKSIGICKRVKMICRKILLKTPTDKNIAKNLMKNSLLNIVKIGNHRTRNTFATLMLKRKKSQNNQKMKMLLPLDKTTTTQNRMKIWKCLIFKLYQVL